MPRDHLTPAQQRLLDELLAPDAPRPPVDPDLARRLRARIEEDVAPAAELVPPGEQLVIHKSVLAALRCEGRFLDRQERGFTWSLDVVRGKLTHRAIELDWITDRVTEPGLVVDRAWRELQGEGRELAAFIERCDALDAATVRHEAAQLVTDLRDLFPPIPSRWSPRLEQPAAASFAGGAVALRGRPDLTIGAVARDRAQVVVIDLKTGWRRPATDRRDLRFYALLLTLKYGVPPFRLATYYVAEGAWDSEDVTPALLEAAAGEVTDAVRRAVRLSYRRPDEASLALEAGAHCRWCSRAPRCPAAAAADGPARPAGPALPLAV